VPVDRSPLLKTSGHDNDLRGYGVVAMHLWRNQGPQITTHWSGGIFLLQAFIPRKRRLTMMKNEIAFAKQAVLTTRDWDTFQAILRKCLSYKPPQPDKK
jgi:hypothetical protein